jgi:hypothetical protein
VESIDTVSGVNLRSPLIPVVTVLLESLNNRSTDSQHSRLQLESTYEHHELYGFIRDELP